MLVSAVLTSLNSFAEDFTRTLESKYIKHLAQYLKSFFIKIYPLINFNEIQDIIDSKFEDDQEHIDKSIGLNEEEEIKKNELFCNICNKSFAKETLMDAHMKSKKHLKKVNLSKNNDTNNINKNSQEKNQIEEDILHDIKYYEYQIIRYKDILQNIIDNTISQIHKKQTMTKEELESDRLNEINIKKIEKEEKKKIFKRRIIYGSINELIKRIDNKKKIYTKEEKELIALKEELFMTRNTPGHQKSNINIEVGKKNAEGEFDLSTFLPMNTKALLEMKKSYGFYLNKFLVEYNRMKKMNNVIYRDKIQRCYKTQNSIASELCACVENLLSSMDMYTTNENWETPTGDNKIDKPKIGKENNKKQNNKEKKDENKKEVDNKNEINEKKEKENINENKINEQSIKNEINNEKKDTEKIDIEESGFNLIKDDNNANNKK